MDDPALIFGNYRALEPLARGGFGQVYRGEHRYLSQRVVAIKVMRDAPLQTQQERDEFLREANLLELLKHPSILPLLDVGIQEHVPYLITEYASGGSLRQRLLKRQGQPLPLDEAMAILAPVANALHMAHEYQVIHRDLKPDNILFNARGDVLLADFGIATLLNTASYHQTRIIGTPAYMAPEQFRGQVCKESDQYALSCLAYELFTGQPPFAKAGRVLDFYSLMFHHVQEQPQSPDQLNPNLPAQLSVAILKALSKERTERYPTILAFLEALQSATQTTIRLQTRPTVSLPPQKEEVIPTHIAQPPAPTNQELLNYAEDLLDQQRYEEALKACEQAIRLHLANASTYVAMGYVLDELGRYTEALAAYEQALQFDPADALAYNNKGYTLSNLGRYDEALAACEQAIQLDPSNAIAYATKGDILQQLHYVREAKEAYKKARTLGWEG